MGPKRVSLDARRGAPIGKESAAEGRRCRRLKVKLLGLGGGGLGLAWGAEWGWDVHHDSPKKKLAANGFVA